MPLAKGQRVIHPTKPDWGVGQVLEDASSTSVRIFFTGAGEKELFLSHITPRVVTGAEASHAVLDNLRIVRTGGTVRYESLPHVIDRFLELFPHGFYGNRYLEEERNYKIKAHELAASSLAAKELKELVSSGKYDEICKRALKVVNSTNLIFPNEKMTLKDGLSSTASQRLFATTLESLLYSSSPLETRFLQFSNALQDIGAAKWTIASYFPFFVSPSDSMFIKPAVTQKAAEMSAFEINYRPKLNWLTYKSILDFSHYLRKELIDLKPRDMIDVQSFMWCIAPEI